MKEFKGFGKAPEPKKNRVQAGFERLLEEGVQDPDTGKWYVTIPNVGCLEYYKDDKGEAFITPEEICRLMGTSVSDFHYWQEHIYEPEHGLVEPKTFDY